MTRFLLFPLLVLVWGCAPAPLVVEVEAPPEAEAVVSDQTQIRPQARPIGPPITPAAPPSNARTEEQFDTTSTEERTVALQTPAPAAERALGTTIASLGSPAEPGFWLKTPLVQEEMRGRVVYPANGKSVQLTLIPIDGPPTAGSRLSLSALRLLEAPLTGLPEIEVFANG